ncbi:MAG: 1-acyl-sn-glycerol-3-phosphate acyltransferase [Pyrinomonadaceae bacterium]|nr:1-acyl-sn-glycerol-3-phosphate acyltransferase [Pyrinomonadaceae bacterium]MBP6213113.1 1-acyl-sn-glycerol-3-phosphate acyltransferase [Pyrinomonadaceae bacterium]
MTRSKSAKYPPQFIVTMLQFIAYAISKTVWFIRYEGGKNIPPVTSGGFLIAANHQTYLDPVWICLPMRRRIRYLAIEKAFGWRFIGPLIRFLGAFPVKQTDGLSVSSIKEALHSLREGAVLTIFPEGGREFEDGVMFPFKQGAVRLAIQAGVPILPVTVRGGNLIWPQGRHYPRVFRRVEIIYHPLLNVQAEPGLTQDEYLDKWTGRLREIIASGAEIGSN